MIRPADQSPRCSVTQNSVRVRPPARPSRSDLWRRLARPAILFLAACSLLIPSAAAWAQGVLIVVDPPRPVPLPRPIIIHRPRPQPAPMSYKIKELTLEGKIVDQVARIQVGQSFVNTGSRQMEVCFVFPLPYDGAIDQLTFMVDGREIPGKLLPAKEARSVYEGYVRRNQDPALLEWVGTGMFKTSVFPVPPGAERKVTLRYSQLLRKDHQLTDFLFPLSTAKYTSAPVEKLAFNLTIESSSKLKSVYSPTHAINIKRPDENHATVSFEAKNTVPNSDFRLFYDTAKGEVGASVLSYRPNSDEDGFFLLLASPEFKKKSAKRPPKTVIFVVDRSGSMSGKKIEQAKEALRFVLNNLREGDLFNIVAYDSSVESFRPELQKYDEATRKAALGFVEGIYAGGSTNIEGALSSALESIQDDTRPTFVLFLTDGRPTAGEKNESKIVTKARQQNNHHARVISFGVGYDVNSRLLDRLSLENYGTSQYVRPDEDLEEQVSRLYSRISSPVMTGVEVSIEVDESTVEEGPSVNRVYPKEVYDLFEGEQLVLVGRYKNPGNAKVTIKGHIMDKKQKMDFPAELVKSSSDQSYAFVEKLWAMRRIGQIIDDIDLNGKNDELIKELVELSTKHGILTPYTSFLADENARHELANIDSGIRRAEVELRQLEESGGISGFAQRAQKQELKSARLAAPQATPAADAPAGERLARNRFSDAFGAGRGQDQSASRGLGGGGIPGAASGPAPAGAATYRSADDDRLVLVDTVKSVGNQTLYRTGKTWFAADTREVDLEKDKKDIVRVKRFSDDYFKLVAANTPSENAVLADQKEGEELVIRLRKKVYLIE